MANNKFFGREKVLLIFNAFCPNIQTDTLAASESDNFASESDNFASESNLENKNYTQLYLRRESSKVVK